MSLREVAEVGAVNLSVDGIRVCLKVEPSRWSSGLGFSALRVGAPTWKVRVVSLAAIGEAGGIF